MNAAALLLTPILLPIGAGLLALGVPGRVKWLRESVAALAVLATLAVTVRLLVGTQVQYQTDEIVAGIRYFDLRSGHFSALMAMFASIISFVVLVSSFRFMEGAPRAKEYYAYVPIALGAMNGAVLSENLVPFMVFWGIVLVMLFLLTTMAAEGAPVGAAFGSAYRVLMVLGAADVAMIVGLGLLWHATGSFSIGVAAPLLRGVEGTVALVFIVIGALAKIGAVPFHSWIPQMSETAHVPVMGFLPAALDKLLGVYLLTRLVIAVPTLDSGIGLFLMSVGALTVLVATLTAMMQSDARRLLAYLAVASAGYILLGLGTGTGLGMGGGLYYLLNTVVWMCCLFLCIGAVQRQAGTTSLEALGGLGRAMPVTFGAAVVAGVSMSAVPPLGGFVAKWIIYQGILEAGASTHWLFLVVAMFGSALTLAAVVKLLHSVFMGERPVGLEGVREAPWSMLASPALLASTCVVFGVGAQLLLQHFVCRIVGDAFCVSVPGTVTALGLWHPGLATVLLLAGIAVGALLYLMGSMPRVRESAVYIGGEVMEVETTRVLGTQFFDTVASFKPLAWALRKREPAVMDAYSYGKPFFVLAGALKALHAGRLSLYLLWCLLGLVVLALVLVGVR